jgi:hypothetical protein
MNISGVNIDPRNPVGDPPAAKLAGFAYARFLFNVSDGTGSQDIEAAHRIYKPRIEALRDAGIKSIIVVNHQTSGEGRGYNWNAMTAEDWNRHIGELVDAIRKIASRYVGMENVYQISNEMDASSEASIYIPPTYYGALFRLAHKAIKDIDLSAKVIVGGLVSGPGKGIAYFDDTGIRQHDGIGIHLYGAGAGGLYQQFGTVEQQLKAWAALRAPLWVTEFGVLNRAGEPESQVAKYAAAFVGACRGKVKAACWYGWGEGMHNGYGIENRGMVRASLFDALMTPPPVEYKPIAVGVYELSGNGVRVRSSADTSAPIITTLNSGARVKVTEAHIIGGGNYGWQRVEFVEDGQLFSGGYMALHGDDVTWSLVPVFDEEPPADPRDEALVTARAKLVSIQQAAAEGIAAIDAVIGETN